MIRGELTKRGGTALLPKRGFTDTHSRRLGYHPSRLERSDPPVHPPSYLVAVAVVVAADLSDADLAVVAGGAAAVAAAGAIPAAWASSSASYKPAMSDPWGDGHALGIPDMGGSGLAAG